MIFGILILLLMVGVSGCTSATPYPSTATITAVRLGPTSTSEPIPPSPTPPPPTETLRPIDPITTNDWSRGPQDAPITFLIYSDFQCPYCRALEDVLSQLEVLHEDEIQVVFRHFPLLSIHDKASLAGQAAEAAGEQGQFWEMHDFLFQNQPEWTLLSPDAFVEYLIRAGSEFELDNVKFAEDIETEKWRPVMEASYLQGLQSGLTGTPFIFMNGTWLQLEPNLENLASLVRLSLLDERRFDSPPEILIDLDQTYYAILQLPEGNVVMELFSRIAPHNVNNFVFLAEQGWFDHNPIYRVTRTAIVETGDPSGTGYGNPGYLLKDEISSAPG